MYMSNTENTAIDTLALRISTARSQWVEGWISWCQGDALPKGVWAQRGYRKAALANERGGERPRSEDWPAAWAAWS